MAALASHLSGVDWNYSFVVSFTQDTINSGLREYLSETAQPPIYVCFLAGDDNNPATSIGLEEFLNRTGQVNPFDIPSGTPATDPRVQAATAQGFQVGVKIQMGLPPGVSTDYVAPIVELGDDAKNVTFNMLCSSLEVIQNTSTGSGGSWDVWSQPIGEKWYFKTSVDLKMSLLDPGLNTKYFDIFPHKKVQIQDKLQSLQSLSDKIVILQQLLFDLDSIVIQLPPAIPGMPTGSDAEIQLRKTFVDVYADSMRAAGEPLLAVLAQVVSPPDPSQLCMTAFERQVSPYSPGPNVFPTPEQIAVTTLDFLCMTQGSQPPTAAKFDWNWMHPLDFATESGVVAINRNVIAQHLLDNFILPHAKASCFTSLFEIQVRDVLGDFSHYLEMVSGQTPQSAIVTEKGANVISICWQSNKDPHTKSSYSDDIVSLKGEVVPSYCCQVSFVDTTIVIEQQLQVYASVKWSITDWSFYPYDTTTTDVYGIYTDGNGCIQFQLDTNKHTSVDKSTPPNQNAPANLITSMNDLGNDIKSGMKGLVAPELNGVAFNSPQSFIFPGANTFTYASACFSSHQDLVCDIHLEDPNTF